MKLGKILLNILFLAVVVLVGYRFLNNPSVSDISVDCSYTYDGTLNTMTYSCDIADPSSLISTDYPLTLNVETGDTVVESYDLQAGSNIVTLDNLLYGSSYTVHLDGYTYDGSTYTEDRFYVNAFNTIDALYTVPTVTFEEVSKQDTEYTFSVNVTDPDQLTTVINYDVYDGDTLVSSDSMPSPSTPVTIDQLDPLTTYSIVFTVHYTLDENDNHATYTFT